MPLVYLGTGWLIGIAIAAAFRPPIDFLLPAFLVPIAGLVLWWKDQRAQHIQFDPCGRTAVLLISVALSWQSDNQLHVVALDIDGHSVFVRTSSGKQVLI